MILALAHLILAQSMVCKQGQTCDAYGYHGNATGTAVSVPKGSCIALDGTVVGTGKPGNASICSNAAGNSLLLPALNGAVNVLQYAKCDGVTDDTTNIDNAITATGARGMLLWPLTPGQFCIYNGIGGMTPLDQQIWIGPNNFFKTVDCTGLANTGTCLNVNALNEFTLKNFYLFSNNAAGGTTTGVQVTNSTNVTFEHVRVSSNGAPGRFVRGFQCATCTNTRLEDVTVQSTSIGLQIITSSSNVVVHGGLYSNASNGGVDAANIVIENSENILVDEALVDEAPGAPSSIWTSTSKGVTIRASTVWVAANSTGISVGSGNTSGPMILGNTIRAYGSGTVTNLINIGATPGSPPLISDNILSCNSELTDGTGGSYAQCDPTTAGLVDNSGLATGNNVNNKSFGLSITGAGTITTSQLATPVNATFSSAQVVGCILHPSTTYAYRIQAYDGANQPTLPSTETTTTTAGTTGNTYCVQVKWAAVQGANYYGIFGRTSGAEQLIGHAGAADTSFEDTGNTAPSGALATANTTGGVTVAGSLTYQTVTMPHVQMGCDAGTGGLLSVTFGRAYASQPACTCSDTNSTLSACDVTTRNVGGAQFKAAGTDTICWQCGDINNN